MQAPGLGSGKVGKAVFRHAVEKTGGPGLMRHGRREPFRGEQGSGLAAGSLHQPAQVAGQHGQGMAAKTDQHHGEKACEHDAC